MRDRLASLLAVLAFGAGALAPTALASSGTGGALADCNAHAQLTQTYPAGQLQSALRTMPADQKEYTDCYDVIQRALLADIGGIKADGSGSGDGGSSFLPTPLLIVLGVLVAGAGVFAVIAYRRRST